MFRVLILKGFFFFSCVAVSILGLWPSRFSFSLGCFCPEAVFAAMMNNNVQFLFLLETIDRGIGIYEFAFYDLI